MREGMISCTLLAKFVRNGAFRGAVSTESPPGAIFLVHCCSVQGGRLIEMQVRIQCGYEAEYVAAFLAGSVRGKVARGAPCAFQRLRLGGKALDGELARLVPRAVLTSARTDAVSPLRARAFPPAPLSLKAEIRPRTTFPLCTTSALSVSAGGRYCSQAAPETRFVSAEGCFCSPTLPPARSVSAEARLCSPTPLSAKLPHIVPC